MGMRDGVAFLSSSRLNSSASSTDSCLPEAANWRSRESLPDFLKRWNVPGMEGLDTRALTRHLRINGAMRGIISTETDDREELVRRIENDLLDSLGF